MRDLRIEIHLARGKHEVIEMLEKDGVDQIIGRDHIHHKVFEAVQGIIEREKPGADNDQ